MELAAKDLASEYALVMCAALVLSLHSSVALFSKRVRLATSFVTVTVIELESAAIITGGPEEVKSKK
jgi:hypothetical protein